MCTFKEVTLLVLVFATLYTGILCSDNRMKNFCYFTNWSHQRANVDARFQLSDINVTLCTHLIYAFANVDRANLGLQKFSADDDNGDNRTGRYYDFNHLKTDHPELVTLLSVGGASAGSDGFIQVVQSETTMKTFSENVVTYLRVRGFDGIDIDWEWPNALYKDKFSQLLQIMWDEFVSEAARTNKARLLLSIAVGVGENTITDSYNIPSISQHVDYIQVMTYDFHGPWSQVTSFSGPLYSRASNPRFNQKLSQAWAIDRWISGGAPRDKLVMGLTAAATTFTLSDASVTDVGSSVAAAGPPGPYLGQSGHVTYYRVCEMISDGATRYWDDEQKMAYIVQGNQWVGYANQTSMEEKVTFADSRNLAGMMIWSLDLDDFRGTFCNAGKYPLITTIYNTINRLFSATKPQTSSEATISTSQTTAETTRPTSQTTAETSRESTRSQPSTTVKTSDSNIRTSISNSLLLISVVFSYIMYGTIV